MRERAVKECDFKERNRSNNKREKIIDVGEILQYYRF